MHKERIVGIDFGTSTSVLRVKNYDENGKPIGGELFTESVKFNQGASMVPSVIRKVNETYDFGYDAEVATRNAEYFRAFKIGLQSADETEREQAKWLVQEYFKYIYNVYNHQLITGNLGDKDSVNKTIVSYPVKWGADLEQFMIQTAEKAGFENVSGMDEAEAAIRAVTVQCKDIIKKSGLLEDGKPSNVMLIDMGAGTTDIVISKYIPGKDVQNEIITTWPKKGDILFGGQEVDVLLRDFLISRFPQEYREKVEKRLSVDKMKAWKENIISPVLEAGKEAITESYEAYDLADRFDTEYEEFTLDRNSFEELYHAYIAQFVELVSGAVQEAKLSPADIDLVILTGGHSKWYFVKELLTDKNQSFDALGLEKIKAEPDRILSVALPQETVALGLVYSKISGTLIFDKKKHLGSLHEDHESNPSLETEENMIDVKAWYDLGCRYFEKENYEMAVQAFSKASDSIKEAAFYLGGCYHYGLGVQQDKLQALMLYKQAYEQGSSDAQESYGELIMDAIADDEELLEKYFIADDVISYDEIKNFYSKEENKQSSTISDSRDFVDKFKASFNKTRVEQKTEGPDKFKNNAQIDYAKSLWENREEHIITRDFYIGENIPSKELNVFLSNFDRESWQSHTPILYYNAFSTMDGKWGFLITDKAIFQYPIPAIPVDTRNISSIEYVHSEGIVITEKGGVTSKLTVFNHSEPSEGWLAEFLNNLVTHINKSREDAPVKFNGNSPVEYAMYLCRSNKKPIEIGSIGRDIPKDAVNNFLFTFGIRDGGSQELIYFHDSTLFGSGKNGFLLTNTTLFWREFLSPSYRIDIQNIRDVILTDDKKEVCVLDKQGHEQWIYINGSSTSTTFGVYRFLKALIKFMQNLNA